MTDISYNESEPVSGGPALFDGVWIHLPGNEQLTSHNFLYGRDARSYSMEVPSTAMDFAGRTFQVVEFGEHQSDEFNVSLMIPHGPDYYSERDALREFLTLKSVVVVRDNRGHVIFGTIGSLDEDHESEGSVFAFSVVRVHQEVTEIL